MIFPIALISCPPPTSPLPPHAFYTALLEIYDDILLPLNIFILVIKIAFERKIFNAN